MDKYMEAIYHLLDGTIRSDYGRYTTEEMYDQTFAYLKCTNFVTEEINLVKNKYIYILQNNKY